MKGFTLKIILAILFSLAILASGKSSYKRSLRGYEEKDIALEEYEIDERNFAVEEHRNVQSLSKGRKGGKGKGKKSSKSPKKSKGKGKKSSKSPKSKGGKGKDVKSSKSPKSKGGKGKGVKSSKSPKSKGGKGKKSSKGPKSKGGKGKKSSKGPKGKGGKGGKGKNSSKAPVVPTASPTIAPVMAPTNSCGITDVQRIAQIRSIISEVTDLSIVDSAGTPQNLAYLWLIGTGPDSLFVCPDDVDFVLQRYILGVVYFAFDGDNWDRCNRGSSNCRSIVNKRSFQPYLSKANVCQWFGITCNEDDIVTRVVLGGEDFFVGVNGLLPTELFKLSKIRFIIFDGSKSNVDTRKIRGTIPKEIANAKFLKRLDLDRNELTGPIPEELLDITTLELLDLDNNLLTGTIPSNFTKLENLFFVTIGNNNFEGQPMPDYFVDLENLGQIGLQNSKLTGTIPAGYANLKNVGAIDISFNQLEGDLSVFDNYENLRSFSVNNNKFTGEVPAVIWANKDMQVIDVESNKLEGEIPASVGELDQLITLRLANNKFTGAIPSSLGDLASAPILKLKTITLEKNKFDKGTIVPAVLCNIPGIEITIDKDIGCPGNCCTIVG